MSEREPGWFERSSWADRDWKAALDRYWEDRARLRYPWRPDECPDQAAADARIRAAREDYRRRILSWYRSILTPFGNEAVVPKRVGELMFEEWELTGCDPADAVSL